MSVKPNSRIVLIVLLVSMVVSSLVLLFLNIPPGAAQIESLVVNITADTDDGACTESDCSLREAISAANSSAGADTISFSLAPSSTIVLNGNELPLITDTLTIDGGTAVHLTISGNKTSRIFVIGSFPPPRPSQVEGAGVDVRVAIHELNLIDGDGNFSHGGAIFNDGILTLTNSTVSNTIALNGAVYNANRLSVDNSTFISNSVTVLGGSGGAVFNANGAILTVTNSIFLNNLVDTIGGGGAIANFLGQITISNSHFEGNSTHSNSGGTSSGGGAIHSFNGGLITNSTFTNNLSRWSGGAVVGYNELTIIDSEFYGNSAVIGGGALSLTGNSGNHLIIGSTFSDNSAKDGGAIAAYSPVTVTNSTIYSNSAQSGGAIYVGDIQGNLTVSNSTLSHNRGNFMGGGIYNSRFLKMSNSIIANSSAGGDCVDMGTIVVNENNLIGDGSCFPAYDGDPLLGLLQDNGGATETMVPMTGSLAIDNGSEPYCEMLDQRGWLRPIDGDGNGTAVCDIGAVEVGPWLEFMAAVFRP